MNKKLISILLTLSTVICSTTALADTVSEDTKLSATPVQPISTQVPALGGELMNGKIVFREVNGSQIILNGYDKDGRLAYSESVKVTDGTAEASRGILEYLSNTPRAYVVGESTFYNVEVGHGSIAAPTATPVPMATPSPEPTDTPSATAKPYNPNNFPTVYEKATTAMYAFSVIDEVTTESNNSTIGTRVKYYFQGKEYSDWFENDVTIVSAPDVNNNLVGKEMSALQRGDVVYFNRRMNGTIKEAALIYRAQEQNIITNETDFGDSFEKLFSVSGTAVAGYSQWKPLAYGSKASSTKGTYYAFGLSAKRENTVVHLLNKAADVNEALSLSMLEDTIVYECDMSKTEGVKVARMSAIPSAVPNKLWNDAFLGTGNKIDVNKIKYDYALARIVDGTVMDIIVYTNY